MAKSSLKNPENDGDEKARSGFRRGNINLDLLEPEGLRHLGHHGLHGRHGRQKSRDYQERRFGRPAKKEESSSDEVTLNKDTKRGMFDKNRSLNPVGPLHIALWTILFLSSLAGLVAIFLGANSVFWLPVTPIFIAVSLWSLMMLVLFKSRPR